MTPLDSEEKVSDGGIVPVMIVTKIVVFKKNEENIKIHLRYFKIK